VEIEHYRGPKKPKMPAVKTKKSATYNYEISGEHRDLFIKQGTRNRLYILAGCDNIR